jgi:hypothetical protein
MPQMDETIDALAADCQHVAVKDRPMHSSETQCGYSRGSVSIAIQYPQDGLIPELYLDISGGYCT